MWPNAAAGIVLQQLKSSVTLCEWGGGPGVQMLPHRALVLWLVWLDHRGWAVGAVGAAGCPGAAGAAEAQLILTKSSIRLTIPSAFALDPPTTSRDRTWRSGEV